MSGIVGIWNMDGAPVDRALLGRMTDSMTFRGPDAQKIWIDGANPSIGFGHTLLKTTFESEFEQQPLTLDGKVWIVADARVDAQDELIAKLSGQAGLAHRNVDWLTDPRNIQERQAPPAPESSPLKKGRTTDVELILRAYHAWGEDCVHHLLGDFSFAIWDGRERRLFCARDHMGVKPFYYARIGQTLIFSNTLDCVRQHPKVSDELNDLAIADFLLFEGNLNPATTSYADVQCLPPAHRLIDSGVEATPQPYWALPVDEPLFLKTHEYVAQFNELLRVAVMDRLRTANIGIFMSGGLDSTALAAATCEIRRSQNLDLDVKASTTVIDGFDQNEREYASLAAEYLKIPVHFQDLSRHFLDPRWSQSGIHTPEPIADPMRLPLDREHYSKVARNCRVWFYGEGPDNAMKYEWQAYLEYLARNGRYAKLLADVTGHAIREKRVPLLPSIFRILRDRRQIAQWRPAFPAWLRPNFVDRWDLRARWDRYQDNHWTTPEHRVRPRAHGSFHPFFWNSLLRGFDPEESGVAWEGRHPFLDLRLLRFMLAVPAVPWCRRKYLIRRSMRGKLPARILQRPKAPLTDDISRQGIENFGVSRLVPDRRFEEFVDSTRVFKKPATDKVQFRTNLRPFVLNFWLHNAGVKPHTSSMEANRNVTIGA